MQKVMLYAGQLLGMLGFKGSRKGTPFAAQMAAEDAAKKAIECGMKSVELFLNGARIRT